MIFIDLRAGLLYSAASGTTAQVTIVAGEGSLGVVAFLPLYAS